MFSSEQIFEVSGDMDQLEKTIDFAVSMHGLPASKTLSYQITKDGKYCLGWYDENGWKKLPFEYDAHIIAEIVKQHLNKQDCENPYSSNLYDGSSEKGFLMKVIDNTFSDEENGIKHPFYGIVSIEPFYNYYAK